ncbi:hypothetical protein Taro_034639, partial [Colocasia esculenta]|nr:hypothetical protein [Colocasia esculenta]
FPSGDPAVERPVGSCGVAERLRGARRRRSCVVKALVWVRFFVIGILLVCLPAVAMARRVATSEEASARSGATLSRRGWRSRSRQGFCRDALLGRNKGCRGALPRRDGVATALGVVTVPVLPRVLPWAQLCVDVCPRAGLALRTFW